MVATATADVTEEADVAAPSENVASEPSGPVESEPVAKSGE